MRLFSADRFGSVRYPTLLLPRSGSQRARPNTPGVVGRFRLAKEGAGPLTPRAGCHQRGSLLEAAAVRITDSEAPLRRNSGIGGPYKKQPSEGAAGLKFSSSCRGVISATAINVFDAGVPAPLPSCEGGADVSPIRTPRVPKSGCLFDRRADPTRNHGP